MATRVPALSNVTVLEIGDGWTCALAGRLLMDMGADVTKLELPWGDSLRSYGRDDAERRAAFALPNRDKHMLDDELVLDRLRAGDDDTDVLLIDAAAAQRLGIDVAAVGPRTVVCRFSPFDVDGPQAAMVANDLTLQAMSGVMATTGEPGGRPLRSGTELSNTVGALYGAIGVMAALIERERSHLGQLVDVSLYDCMVATLTNFASRVLGGVEPLGLLGNQGPNSAPWELFEASDGEYVFIIAGSNPTFARLATTMGRPELLDDPRFATHGPRRDHYVEITAIVADWAKTLPRDEIVTLLRANGVPVSPVASVQEVLTDGHLRSRGVLAADADGAELLTVGPALGFPCDATGAGSPVARVGATTNGVVDSHKVGSTRPPPLDGVRVVDLGTLTAGPYCTRLLANLGADVLKIEPPDGEPGRHMPPIVDGESVFFQISNNGKRSLQANLRDPRDVAMVAQVLTGADIMVSNQAPGGLEKRGLGPEAILAVAPDLIYTTVSGFGNGGVLGGLRAYDTVIQAATGLMSLTGEEDGPPLKTGISTADVLGSLAAAAASLGAYFGRITGRNAGVRLDVALYDICSWSTQMSWVTEQSNLPGATRHGNGHWLFAPYGVFVTGDEQSVAIACESDAQWHGLADVLAAASAPPEGFARWDRAERWAHRDELNTLIQSYCAAMNLDDVVNTLQRHGVPCGPVIEVQDVMTTRQQIARTTVDTRPANGRFWKVTDFPIRLRATPGAVTTPAPPLGSDDRHIREDPDTAWNSVADSEETGIRVSK
jgi:crotonobetainyl-CoA:carnitine CoA-transferase CaiB-like acyl-CoA transferase